MTQGLGDAGSSFRGVMAVQSSEDSQDPSPPSAEPPGTSPRSQSRTGRGRRFVAPSPPNSHNPTMLPGRETGHMGRSRATQATAGSIKSLPWDVPRRRRVVIDTPNPDCLSLTRRYHHSVRPHPAKAAGVVRAVSVLLQSRMPQPPRTVCNRLPLCYWQPCTDIPHLIAPTPYPIPASLRPRHI